MIPIIEIESEFYKITLQLDLDGKERKTYWANDKKEIPSIVERHILRMEDFSRYFS